MTYSIAYIKQIAEFILGDKNERAVMEYVRDFNADDPKYEADEQRFITERGMDGDLAEQREKFRVTNYYLDSCLYDFYRGDMFAGLYLSILSGLEKTKNFSFSFKMIEDWIKDALTLAPEAEEEGSPDMVDAFHKKYGVNLNVANVSSAIAEIETDKNKSIVYGQYYKVIFQSVYKQIEGEKPPISEFCSDFERLFNGIRAECVSGKDLASERYAYGGMSGAQLKDFLLGIKDEECNLSRMVKALDVGKHKPQRVALHKAEIDRLLKEKGDDKNKLRLCVAHLKAMEAAHSAHSNVFKVMSFLKYGQESSEIASVQKDLVSKFGAQEFAEVNSQDQIYTQEYYDDLDRIEAISASLAVSQSEGELVFANGLEESAQPWVEESVQKDQTEVMQEGPSLLSK